LQRFQPERGPVGTPPITRTQDLCLGWGHGCRMQRRNILQRGVMSLGDGRHNGRTAGLIRQRKEGKASRSARKRTEGHRQCGVSRQPGHPLVRTLGHRTNQRELCEPVITPSGRPGAERRVQVRRRWCRVVLGSRPSYIKCRYGLGIGGARPSIARRLMSCVALPLHGRVRSERFRSFDLSER